MNYEDRVTKEYLENAIANAGVKIVTGSYVGNGQTGAEHPCSLTFPFPPKMVWIYQWSGAVMTQPILPGMSSAYLYCGSMSYNIDVSFEGMELSWYSTLENTTAQMNGNNTTYYWVAIG